MKRRGKKIKGLCSIIVLMTFALNFTLIPSKADAATVTLSAPTSVKAVSASYNSINVSWIGVTGASGYAVYRATSSAGTYALVYTTTGGNYNNTGLATGSTYYYKIRAYTYSGTTRIYGSYSAATSARVIPSAPTSVKAVSISYNTINISWAAVTGANGYVVYRAQASTGTYAAVSTISGTSYNNTGLATGTTYYYEIRAYRTVGTTNVYSNLSATAAAKPIPSVPTSVKAVSSSYNSINVSWAGVTGASGYEVYRAASSTGTYALISTTTAGVYNNTGLATISTYYYKVRAYRLVGTVKVYSNFSSAVYAKPVPTAPTSVKAVTSSYNGVNVSWGGVTGANGYEVYRATSNAGTYSLASTASSLSFADTGLLPSTAYYYKVRAYSIVSGIKVYSDFSAIVSSTTASASVTSVSLNKSSDTLKVGATETLTATVNPSYAFNKSVSWASSNPSAATVDSSGKVTAVGSGSAVITVKTADGGYTASCTITVVIPVTSVSLNKDTESLTVGAAEMLTATLNPLDATNKNVTWTSNNPSAATVDSNGKVTALNSGTAVITVSTADGGYTATCTITIAVPVTSVSLDKSTDILILGDSDILTASIAPANATNKGVIWTSSDNTVAAVDGNGNITSVNAGTAVITVATVDGGFIASCMVTVNKAQIKGIDVSRWQGAINWASVKSAGIQFAMIRSSYGDGTSRYTNNGIDPYFETNYSAAKANGIAVGAYHYSYATTVAQAAAEANFFISRLQGKQFEYPVCIDIEDSSQSALDTGTLTDIVLTYLNMLKQAGYYPIIYSSRYWFGSELDDTRLASYDHWVAQWGTSLTYTGEAGMWQYSSNGTVAGITDNVVDLDTSFIDYAARIKQLHLNGF